MPSPSEMARAADEREDDFRWGVDKDAPLKITLQRGDAVAEIQIGGLMLGYALDVDTLVAASISPSVRQIMEMTNG